MAFLRGQEVYIDGVETDDGKDSTFKVRTVVGGETSVVNLLDLSYTEEETVRYLNPRMPK